MYRVDIFKNGSRWDDTVGVAASSDDIAATAVSLACEAVLETAPVPGCRCVAEVYDADGQKVLEVQIVIAP